MKMHQVIRKPDCRLAAAIVVCLIVFSQVTWAQPSSGPFVITRGNEPNATVVSGDAVDVVARLKEESPVPLRSHGSLAMHRALMAAGLVDRVQVTIFPVITGRTGEAPIFGGAADFDLELLESRTLDGRTQELIYRPSLHV